MNLFDIMKALATENIETSMKMDDDGKHYVDLQTMAKSHLYLYEDGTLKGRYDYETMINLNASDFMTKLCEEFNHALHGRSYHQEGWASLCHKHGVSLEKLF